MPAGKFEALEIYQLQMQGKFRMAGQPDQSEGLCLKRGVCREIKPEDCQEERKI